MKTLLLSLTLFAFLFTTSCIKKECDAIPAANEADQIESFATAHSFNTVQHSSGLYYEILDPGSGATLTADSKIVITYIGMLLDGQVFDQQTTPNSAAPNGPWALTDLIEGWRIGIPLIKVGGSIRLIIPSSLAYGCEQYYEIPGNSVLYFEIQLIDAE